MLELDLQFGAGVSAVHKTILTRAFARRWVLHALEPRVTHATITLRIVTRAEGQRLNYHYRKKDYATNVLTFDYARAPYLHADIVLCAPVVAQEARAQHKTLAAHYAHLLVHGLLHAQGYDHETSVQDADTMETLEMLLLLCAGLPNPYASLIE